MEDAEVNLVRTNGLFWRPNLRMREWTWVSFGRLLQEWRRARQLCSAALLLPANVKAEVIIGTWNCTYNQARNMSYIIIFFKPQGRSVFLNCRGSNLTVPLLSTSINTNFSPRGHKRNGHVNSHLPFCTPFSSHGQVSMEDDKMKRYRYHQEQSLLVCLFNTIAIW